MVGEDLAINAANAGGKVAPFSPVFRDHSQNKSAKHSFHLNPLLSHVDWFVRFRKRGCGTVRFRECWGMIFTRRGSS